MKLSIIIPVFNEIQCIERFTKRIFNCFDIEQYEYIFINDGSNDGTERWLTKNIKPFELSKNITLIDLPKNYGKGYALRKGMEIAKGDYIMLIDSDLEYDPKDCLEMYNIITSNPNIKALFGSRFVSGKIQYRKYFLNSIVARINTFVYNFLFHQSLSDLHCGSKIISRDILDKIKLSINDFGFEIDLASQIVKINEKIFQYGISYVGRTFNEGKKITWKDGLLTYYYLFKTRFIDNDVSILISTFFSFFFMGYVAIAFRYGIRKNNADNFIFYLRPFFGFKKQNGIFVFDYLIYLFRKSF